MELCNGSDISIIIAAPQIFSASSYWGASLRRNGENLDEDSNCHPNGNVRLPSVTYTCTNMQVNDSGRYTGHNLLNCNGTALEWCTIPVQINVISCSTSVSSSPTTNVQPSSVINTCAAGSLGMYYDKYYAYA